MNPVRASMVTHPGEYRWSSYAATAQGQFDKLITPHPIYLKLGMNHESRQHAYRELFSQNLNKTEVHAIREALNQELVLGREDFKDKIKTMLQRQVRPGNSGRPRVEELSDIYYVF